MHNFISPSHTGQPSKVEEDPGAKLKIFEYTKEDKKTPSLASFFNPDPLLYGEQDAQQQL